MLHDVKIWPQYFDRVLSGAKTCEIRWNDRDYHASDLVNLREWDPATEKYTGREVLVEITDITKHDDPAVKGLVPHHVAMSIRRVH